MIFAVIVLGLLFSLTQSIPAPGHGILAGYCKTSQDCAADECCISFVQPKGKRTIVWPNLSPDLMRLVDGMCQKLATEKQTCIMPGGLMPYQAGLYYDCPCASDLTCHGTGRHAINKGEIGVCDRVGIRRTAIGHPCTSGADCAGDQCCVSNVRPIGKRLSQGSGHCQPMGTSGSHCYTRFPSGKPDDMSLACPCSTNLTCHGSGVYEVPLGEVGTCEGKP